MSQQDWFEAAHPMRSRRRNGREGMPAFVAGHTPFFVLIGVLVAQLLLLAFQITRNHNVRLIHLWAISAFGPFDRALRSVSSDVGHAWSAYGGMWKAEEENHELAAQLAQAQQRIQQLSEAAAENTQLRALLDYKRQAPFSSVAAEVIATSPAAGSNGILIDRGADAGLTRDLAVITPQGVVGTTVAVYPHTAQVLLITDPSSGVGVMLASTRTQGVLKGAGQPLCQLNYIMNDEAVSAGEAILTSGLDQIYPKGLLVGTVAQSGDGNIYKNIEVRPAVALDRLENVLVILKTPAAAEEPPPKTASR